MSSDLYFVLVPHPPPPACVCKYDNHPDAILLTLVFLLLLQVTVLAALARTCCTIRWLRRAIAMERTLHHKWK